MGRRGYAQIREPEYGSCVTDWAQSGFYDYLTEHGLDVSIGNECCNPEDADHWEIEIPYKKGKPGRSPCHDYGKVRKLIADLREHPDKIRDSDGEGRGYGEDVARVLEECLEAAIKQKSDSLVIDWF